MSEKTIKTPKATHQGELDLNGFTLSCAVLEDGTRVFSERSLAIAFGIKGGGAYWKRKKEGGAVLPEYLSAKYLKPFITSELEDKFTGAVSYKSLSGVEATGVDATILPDVCDVFIQAEKNGIKSANIKDVSENAYRMIRAFANVGIIALVDEATGYQYDRERQELQKILKAYISDDLLPWQKRFPDIFYKELFRLNGWDYTVTGIKQRPGVIGKWTNTLIYEQLPKGVLQQLKDHTPKNESGKLKAKLHQSLTLDIGNPHLTQQINKILTLFQLSDSMIHMWSQFERLRARERGQLEIPFKFDAKGHTIEPIDEQGVAEKKKSPHTNFDKRLKGLLAVPKPKD